MTSHSAVFNTELNIDRQIQTEQKINALADFLHRTFADSSDQDVHLTALSHDDFGMSTELRTLTEAFINSGVTTIYADPQERIQTITAVLQIQ